MAAEGLRPILPPGTPAPVVALLEACWHKDPAARPSAAEAAARLAEVARQLVGVEQAVERPGRLHLRAGEQECSGAVPRDLSPSSVLRPSSAASGCGSVGGASASQPEEDCFLSRDSSFASLAYSEDEEMQTLPRSGAASPPPAAPATPERPRGRWSGAAPPAWLAAALGGQPQLAAPAVGAFASAGARGADRMEDRHLILPDLGGWAGLTVFGAFDGHRWAGRRCRNSGGRSLAWVGSCMLAFCLRLGCTLLWPGLG